MLRSQRLLTLSVAGLVLGACHESSSSPTPAAESLGISAFWIAGEGQRVVLFHSEISEGKDLNLDGDQLDATTSLYDRSDGSQVHFPFAVDGPFPGAILGESLIALPVDEAKHGASDLNADGDELDLVVFVYDHRTGLVENTGLEWRGPAVGTDWVLCPVSEDFQGGQDLDGDGEVGGTVLFAYDAVSGTVHNLALQTAGVASSGDEFAFLQSEVLTDLNGDGDTADFLVLRFFDATQGILPGPGFVLAREAQPVNGGWLGLVDEAGHGADLNGDGDTLDVVYHLFQPQLVTVEPLGFSLTHGGISFVVYASERYLVLPLEENDGLDHNGDGDQLDTLWGVYDLLHRQAHETGIVRGHLNVPPGFSGDIVAIPAWEGAAGADLNGDGSLHDFVLHLFRDGSVENTGLETWGTGKAGAGWITVGRSEQLAGQDGNADGDLEDRILHLFDPTTGALVNTHIAVRAGVDLSPKRLFLAIAEGQLGPQGRDLNGDGDAFDDVWTTYEIGSATTRNLRLAADGLSSIGLTQEGQGLFLVSERFQGRDLNGDGDLLDEIVYRLL